MDVNGFCVLLFEQCMFSVIVLMPGNVEGEVGFGTRLEILAKESMKPRDCTSFRNYIYSHGPDNNKSKKCKCSTI